MRFTNEKTTRKLEKLVIEKLKINELDCMNEWDWYEEKVWNRKPKIGDYIVVGNSIYCDLVAFNSNEKLEALELHFNNLKNDIKDKQDLKDFKAFYKNEMKEAHKRDIEKITNMYNLIKNKTSDFFNLETMSKKTIEILLLGIPFYFETSIMKLVK